jgi:hypothetical protein
MKTMKIGNREMNIEGSALTPFFYKKEFKQSMSGDLVKMQDIGDDLSKLDDVNILQMAWALEKTALVDTGKSIKGFESWLKDLGKVDITEFASEVMEEVMDATFHDTIREGAEEGS